MATTRARSAVRSELKSERKSELKTGIDWLGLPLAIAAATYGFATEQWALAAPFVGAGLFSLVYTRRFAPARWVEIMLATLGSLATVAITAALPETTDGSALSPLMSGIALLGLMLAAPRLLLAAPWSGHSATAGCALITMLSCGDTHSGLAYPVLLSAFFPTQLFALGWLDPAIERWSQRSRRYRFLTAGMVSLIVVFAVGLSLAIPPLHRAAVRNWRMNPSGSAKSGFSSVLELGGLTKLLQSDVKVLRVYPDGDGGRPTHLRGLLYTRYRGGKWGAGLGQRPPFTPSKTVTSPERMVEIRTVGGDNGRYFLPLQSRGLYVPGGRAWADPMGIVRPLPGVKARSVSFELGPRDSPPVRTPDPDDLHIPAALVDRLTAIAEEWTAGITAPRAKLEALTQRLQAGYAYSLEFKREEGLDPVLDFLDVRKEGHCEYFASALALLARAVDVPARVAGGYLVTERNGAGGYFVVRERNAHAWVEAWVGGSGKGQGERWATYDATPASGMAAHMPTESGSVAAFFDMLASWWAVGWQWFTQLTALEIAVSVSGLLAFWGLLRLFRSRRKPRERAPVLADLTFEDPLPCLATLLDALHEAAPEREPSEPLERYARRLRESESLGPRAPTAAALLERYAALRYGGVGDAERLAGEIDAFVSARG